MQLHGLVIFIALILASCASQPNYTARAMGIKMDMPKDDVMAIMGQPKRVSARKTEKGVIEKYSWWSPIIIGFTPVDNELISNDRVYISLLNNKVHEWGDKFDYASNMDKAMDVHSETIKGMQNQKIHVTIEDGASSNKD